MRQRLAKLRVIPERFCFGIGVRFGGVVLKQVIKPFHFKNVGTANTKLVAILVAHTSVVREEILRLELRQSELAVQDIFISKFPFGGQAQIGFIR